MLVYRGRFTLKRDGITKVALATVKRSYILRTGRLATVKRSHILRTGGWMFDIDDSKLAYII